MDAMIQSDETVSLYFFFKHDVLVNTDIVSGAKADLELSVCNVWA